MKPKPCNRVLGYCADCRNACLQRDEYIVRNSVWDSVTSKAERLHRECLEKRIGRPLTDADYLARCEAVGSKVMMILVDPSAYAEEQAHYFAGSPDTLRKIRNSKPGSSIEIG